MGDIIATIQAEQDQAIRASCPACWSPAGRARARPQSRCTAPRISCTRTGGDWRRPACCSSVRARCSALHRAGAPSLGEQDVQLDAGGAEAAVAGHGLGGAGGRSAQGRRAHGDARRRGRRSPNDRFREIVLVIDRLRLRITRRHVTDRRRRAGGGTHNEKRPLVARRLVDMLVGRYKQALVRTFRDRRLDEPLHPTDERRRERDEHLRSWRVADPTVAARSPRGDPAPQGWEAELRAHPVAAGSQRSVGADLAGALRSRARQRPVRFHRVDTFGCATSSPRRRSHACTVAVTRTSPATWSDGDVALIDEADALLGPVAAARPHAGAAAVPVLSTPRHA